MRLESSAFISIVVSICAKSFSVSPGSYNVHIVSFGGIINVYIPIVSFSGLIHGFEKESISIGINATCLEKYLMM